MANRQFFGGAPVSVTNVFDFDASNVSQTLDLPLQQHNPNIPLQYTPDLFVMATTFPPPPVNTIGTVQLHLLSM
jgi:hypothetical protein